MIVRSPDLDQSNTDTDQSADASEDVELANNAIVDISHDVNFGGGELIVAAGPHFLRNEEQLRVIASAVKSAGARVLCVNGSIHEKDKFRMLRDVGGEMKMPVQVGLTTPSQIELAGQYADILQIDTPYDTENDALLRGVEGMEKLIVLRRNMSARYKEWIEAAEHILDTGNPNIIFCEQGVRTFELETRSMPDIHAITYMKNEQNVPVQFDVSCAVGSRDVVPPIAAAGVAAGADSLVIKVDNEPSGSSLSPEEFKACMRLVKRFAWAAGKVMHQSGAVRSPFDCL